MCQRFPKRVLLICSARELFSGTGFLPSAGEDGYVSRYTLRDIHKRLILRACFFSLFLRNWTTCTAVVDRAVVLFSSLSLKRRAR